MQEFIIFLIFKTSLISSKFSIIFLLYYFNLKMNAFHFFVIFIVTTLQPVHSPVFFRCTIHKGRDKSGKSFRNSTNSKEMVGNALNRPYQSKHAIKTILYSANFCKIHNFILGRISNFL